MNGNIVPSIDDGNPGSLYHQGGRNPGLNVFVADANGGTPKELADWAGVDGEAVPSLDGRSVVFASDRDGDFEIYRVGISTRAFCT
jgi:Tol biopolymer transport system component